MRSKHSLALAVIGICAAPAAVADHPSLSLAGGPAGPVGTLSATPLPAGKGMIGLRWEHVDFDAYTDGGLEAIAAVDPEADVHTIDSLTSLSLAAAYGVTDDLTVGISLPYVRRENIRGLHHHEEDGETEIERLGNSSGLGDALLYGQFRFYSSADERRQAAAVFGVQAPTGKTDASSSDGERLETGLQPGSGSWDPMLGVVLSQVGSRIGFSASALYKLAGDGSQDTNLGDVLAYNAALSMRLGADHGHPGHDHTGHDHGNLSLLLELNGEWRDEEEVGGVANPNTGGNTVYVSPGLSYEAGGAWRAAVSIGVPVVTDLNGYQADPQWRAIANLSAVF